MPMPSTATDPSPAALWLAGPSLGEILERIARGEQTLEDLQRFEDAAPLEHRGLVLFVARALRMLRVLRETRARAREQVRALVDRGHAKRDQLAGFEACRLIARHGLLDEPPTPRIVGSAVEPGCALEIDVGEVVLTDAIVPLGDLPRARVGLVVAASAVPPPAPLDHETEERLADAIADTFLQHEGL